MRKRNINKTSMGMNSHEVENEEEEEEASDENEGNITPKKRKSDHYDEILSPQTPKSDFANFAEGILSPNPLDTPNVPFSTDVLTPREWSPFGLDLLSATKQSKTLALSGIDLFDTSLTETVSSHSKKFFKEARSLSSLSSPGPSDLIQLKQPASINTDRSSTKYRDLFNSSTEKIDTKLPFQDVADDGVKSRSSLTRYRSKQEEIDDLEFEQQEEKNGKLKKRGRGKLSSQSYDTRSLSTDPTVVQSTLPPSLPSLNSFSSMLPTTVTGMLIPRDDISISSTMTPSESNMSESKSGVTCNCKKSRCLKLYCDCFRLQKYCSGCNCKDCANLKAFEKDRIAARIAITDRNPEAFKPRIAIFETKKAVENLSPRVTSSSSAVIGLHQSGCHCKKSACLKKYCECFQAGVPCHDRCRCQDCQNTAENINGVSAVKSDASSGSNLLSNHLNEKSQSSFSSSGGWRLPTSVSQNIETPSSKLPQLFTDVDVPDDKPIYNKAQAEQAAVDIVCAFLRGQIVVPGLSPATFVPNPSLGQDLPEILKNLVPGCFTPADKLPSSSLLSPSSPSLLTTSYPSTSPTPPPLEPSSNSLHLQDYSFTK